MFKLIKSDVNSEEGCTKLKAIIRQVHTEFNRRQKESHKENEEHRTAVKFKDMFSPVTARPQCWEDKGKLVKFVHIVYTWWC